MSAQRIHFYLDELDSLQPLAVANKQRAEFQKHLQEALPAPLVAGCQISGVYGEVLFLLVENGAIAAKLKQLTPRLLSTFQKNHSQVTGIHIEVQVHKTHEQCAPSRHLSSKSLTYLEDLAAKLPDSLLKQAVNKLITEQRSFSADERDNAKTR